MRRKQVLSLVMLALGVGMLTAAFAVGTAGSANTKAGPAQALRGGTLRLNMHDADFDFVDPALAYRADDWAMLYVTAMQLVSFPEKSGAAGSQLYPQAATSFPTVSKDGKTYTAEMQTSCGTITIELLADQAPQTVNSFVFLAEQGYFDGQRFHRLDTSIDVIQGGDPTATGSGGPGYSIPDELTGKESYGAGVLAMANAGPNTGGSQFFIITGDKGHNLDANPNYTIFGMVTDGLDVAKTIQALPIQDPNAAASGDLSGQQPAEAVYIEKVTIHSD